MSNSCSEDPAPDPVVTSIKLSTTSTTISVGESTTLTATIAPENATDKTITWSSSNTSVATVTNGRVTAISVGTATITAQAGSAKAVCTVTVNPIDVASVTLSQTSVEIFIGEETDLTATVTPENATNKTVIWSSSNTSVATVTNGRVTAISVGTATITAQAGSAKANCTITVKPIEVTHITLSHSSISLLLGESTMLTATVYPDNATDKTITWSSSNSNIATISDGNVVAVGVGYAIITAKAGNLKVECNVAVSPIDVTAVSLNQTSAAISVGETVNLIATVTPDNATYKTLTWSSSDTSVATVSDGLVTAISIGIADIIVTSQNGLSATCRISVINKPPHGGSEGTGEEEW